MWFALALLVTVGLPTIARGGAIYVDASNPNCPGDGSPNNPFCFIQLALDAALDGDEVLVAPGEYREELRFRGHRVSVRSVSGSEVTAIQSTGLGSTITFDQGEDRETELRGFAIHGGPGTTLWGSVKAGSGVFCRGSSPTLRDNVITTDAYWPSEGGAIYLEGGSQPLIDRNTMPWCYASMGAAIFCSQSSPTITGNDITRCYADNTGAGIYCDQASPLIKDNIIADCVAGDGAAVSGSGSPVIDGNRMSHNWSDEHPEGAVYVSGNVTVTNNWFADTRMTCFGPSQYLVDGNTFVEHYVAIQIGGATMTITNNEFRDNHTGLFIDVSGGDITIAGNRFRQNGQAISLYTGGGSGTMVITRNVIADCQWTGIICTDASPLISDNLIFRTGGNEGGIVLDGSAAPLITNNTIVANQGAGIWCRDAASPVITSTIVWGNSGAEILVQSGSPSVSYCDVKGGFPGTGNIDLDPLFRDSARGNFTLQSASPCVDAGDPGFRSCAADLEQNPRVLDGRLLRLPRVDMGALEFDNIHLEAREAPKSFDIAFPGRERHLIITSTGTPGLSATLWVGLGQGTVCDPFYGTLFLDFTKPWAMLPWGTVPSVVTVTLPPEIPPGTALVFQELGLDPSGAGNFSNFVPLVVGR